jgi:hypothetical protein
VAVRLTDKITHDGLVSATDPARLLASANSCWLILLHWSAKVLAVTVPKAEWLRTLRIGLIATAVDHHCSATAEDQIRRPCLHGRDFPKAASAAAPNFRSAMR